MSETDWDKEIDLLVVGAGPRPHDQQVDLLIPVCFTHTAFRNIASTIRDSRLVEQIRPACCDGRQSFAR